MATATAAQAGQEVEQQLKEATADSDRLREQQAENEKTLASAQGEYGALLRRGGSEAELARLRIRIDILQDRIAAGKIDLERSDARADELSNEADVHRQKVNCAAGLQEIRRLEQEGIEAARRIRDELIRLTRELRDVDDIRLRIVTKFKDRGLDIVAGKAARAIYGELIVMGREVHLAALKAQGWAEGEPRFELHGGGGQIVLRLLTMRRPPQGPAQRRADGK